MSVIVCLLSTRRVFYIKWCCSSCTAGILPFSFGGQAIAVCTSVPGNSLSIDGIDWGETILFAFGIAISYCVEPRDIFYGKIIPFKIAGVISCDFFIFLLSQFVFAHIEIADRNGVLCFIRTAPCFGFWTAHLKRTTLYQNKIFRNFFLWGFGNVLFCHFQRNAFCRFIWSFTAVLCLLISRLAAANQRANKGKRYQQRKQLFHKTTSYSATPISFNHWITASSGLEEASLPM